MKKNSPFRFKIKKTQGNYHILIGFQGDNKPKGKLFADDYQHGSTTLFGTLFPTTFSTDIEAQSGLKNIKEYISTQYDH